MLESNLTPTTPVQPFSLEFRGDGKEYFKIWIVNIGLTILTLGIYSAWAKVRTRRYFYNHMYLNGQTFDYHADPLKILKGRVVLVLLGISFSLVKVSPIFLLAPIVFAGFVPYFLVRGAIFNFSNTSFRGVRFGFERAYKESYLSIIKAFLITVFTFGIGTPAATFRMKRFIVDHMALGKLRFKMGGTGRDFWNAVMKEAFLMGLAFAAIVFVILLVLGGLGLVGKEDAQGAGVIIGLGIVILQYVFYGFVFVIYQVRSANYYADHLSADGGLRFRSKLNLGDSFLMYVEQFFLVILTLGLAWPWARIAITRYKAEHFTVLTAPEFFNSLSQGQVQSESAFGEEVASFWDFDIGF